MTTQSNLYIDQGTEYRLVIDIPTDYENEDFFDTLEFYAAASKLYSSSIAIEAEMTKILPTEENPKYGVEMHISADDTIDLAPGKYVYDVIQHDTATGDTKKILEGLIFILQTITRI